MPPSASQGTQGVQRPGFLLIAQGSRPTGIYRAKDDGIVSVVFRAEGHHVDLLEGFR